MDSVCSLGFTLKAILRVLEPASHERSIRSEVIKSIEAAIATEGSLKCAKLMLYGSFPSDLFTRHGDLDMSIDLEVRDSDKDKVVDLLDAVKKVFEKDDDNTEFKLVRTAIVPILSFRRSITKYYGTSPIKCDISINNYRGQRKSNLLCHISRIDNRFREMVLLVKEWARKTDINDAKNGTLSSYALTLLIIFHFQTCTPAILPPLQKICPPRDSADLGNDGIDAYVKKRVDEHISNNRVINGERLEDLFTSFFKMLYKIMSNKHSINVYTAECDNDSKSELYVEDPFEPSSNAARSVSKPGHAKIVEAFKRTHEKLTIDYQKDLLECLVADDMLNYFHRSSKPEFQWRPAYERQVYETPKERE